MLITWVVLYLLATIALGLWVARRVKNTADYAIAGRNLPMVMIVTTTFATWFGAEAVMGVPARFAEGGFGGVIEDPFGAGFCLILVGLFFARKLYSKTLLTISDYYAERYGRIVEVSCAIVIMLSYLGWVAAQVTALGFVFNVLSNQAISVEGGMILGTASILAYTIWGGMWSVAVTDFVQMIVLVVGLIIIAFVAGGMAGGAGEVISFAREKELFQFFPAEQSFASWSFWLAAALTLMLGSIPQQDVFQRVMSANTENAATKGPVIGGILYILFALIPMFLVVSAWMIMPEQVGALLSEDPQKILPTLVMEKMPLVMQIIFFGALLSAIKSCASATLLAPSVTFVENIWRQWFPNMSPAEELRTMRIALLVFAVAVCTYAIQTAGMSIYDMVSGAYQVTLVGAFVPLVFGLYWRRASTQGAIFSILAGVIVWLAFAYIGHWAELFPQQLAGLIAALLGMVLGSLLPQWIAPAHEERQIVLEADKGLRSSSV